MYVCKVIYLKNKFCMQTIMYESEKKRTTSEVSKMIILSFDISKTPTFFCCFFLVNGFIETSYYLVRI